MRLALRADTFVERLALWLGIVPRPAGEAWGAMAVSASLISAVELGVVARLIDGPGDVDELATDLALDPVPLALLLNVLTSAGYLSRRGGVYRVRRAARRWLAPDGTRSVANFVRATSDYWTWWQQLPAAVRTGDPATHHEAAPDDPYWRRYILGQHDLARLSAPVVARRVRVPAGASRLLDIGGGHGRYSVELCRRHPGLTATVFDLPGSVRIGRELVAAQGLADRVRFVGGDARTGDLGGPYDVVLCFNLVHHLPLDQVAALLDRVRAVLAPGGTVAVLDGFAGRRSSAQGDVLGLFTYVSSGVGLHSRADLAAALRAGGFTDPRRVSVWPIPGLALYQAGVR